MTLVWHVARTAFRRLMKSPVTPVLWFSIPLALASVFYFAFGDMSAKPSAASDDAPKPPPRGTLLFHDADRTPLSQLLHQSLQKQPLTMFFETVVIPDTLQVRRLFEEQTGAALLVVPAGFQQAVLRGEPVVLRFSRNPMMTFSPQMIAAPMHAYLDIVNRFLADLQPALAQVAARGSDPTFDDLMRAVGANTPELFPRLASLAKLEHIDVAVQRPAKEEPESMSAPVFSFGGLLAGLMLFGLLFVGDGYERRFLAERGTVLVRAFTSPLRPLHVLLAQGLVVVVAVLTSAAALLLAGVVLFRITIPSPAVVFMVVLGFGLFITGFFKSVYAHAKTERTAGAISTVAILIMAMLGGGFVPIDVYPEPVRLIATQTPFGAASQALTHVLVREQGLAEIAPFAARVWAWGIGFCVIGFTLAGRSRVRS
jgi:ABC-2 type transport system permease protein